MNRAFLSVFVLFQISFLDSAAQITRISADAAFTIIRMAEIYHVQPRAVDKTFSSDLFSQMIRALDADKIYFNGEDLRQLDTWRNTLDDQLQARKEDFLKQLIIIYTKKINRTDSVLDVLSKAKFDLKLNEIYTVSEDSNFAPNEELRAIKLYKMVKRNIIETLVDVYEEDTAKKYSSFRS